MKNTIIENHEIFYHVNHEEYSKNQYKTIKKKIMKNTIAKGNENIKRKN